MEPASYRFAAFELDCAERQLRRDGAPLALNARYLDALILLVSARGGLVTKDRFMAEVWRGIPVTDEALTQCIRTLRRTLNDDVAAPRFIETVPKYGYRFIAGTDGDAPPAPPVQPEPVRAPHPVWRQAIGGTTGAVAAGALGGLVYGMGGATIAAPGDSGSLSIVLVLLCVTIGIAAVGGGAVSLGVALGTRWGGAGAGPALAGGAIGGLAVGALAKLLGIDAFVLLLGRAPEGITGGPEGLALGLAVGLGSWIAVRGARDDPRRALLVGALCGAVAGLVIVLLGGRLLAGSIDALTGAMPGARLDVGRLGALLGETGFGPRSRMLTGVLEGALFGACTVAGLWHGRRGS